MPEKSEIQERLEKRIADQKKTPVQRGPIRRKRPEKAAFLEGCLCSPSLNDLAGFFSVHRTTIFDWFKKHPDYRVLWDKAKSQDQLELLTAARQKALDGSSTHLKIYLSAGRPDLVQPDSQVTVNNNTTKVKILPTPSADGDVVPFKNVIPGQATEVLPDKPKEETSGLPLFGGRVIRPA